MDRHRFDANPDPDRHQNGNSDPETGKRKITNLHLVGIVSFVVGELLQKAVNGLHLSKHQPEQQASIITNKILMQ